MIAEGATVEAVPPFRGEPPAVLLLVGHRLALATASAPAQLRTLRTKC